MAKSTLETILVLSSWLLVASLEPHEHRGKIAPYSSKPPSLSLTPAEERTLARGGSVQKQVLVGAGGRGFVVQDICAPPEVVWERISAFPEYPKMVPNLKKCNVYESGGGKPKTVKVSMMVSVVGISFTYYIDHQVYAGPQGTGVITWTLDYERKSELDESVGYWHVAKHPTKQGWTRVTYSVGILLAPWVPSLVVTIMTNQALSAATTWVKKESEKKAEKLMSAFDEEADSTPAPTLSWKCRLRKFWDKNYECEEELQLRLQEELKKKKEDRQKRLARGLYIGGTLGAIGLTYSMAKASCLRPSRVD